MKKISLERAAELVNKCECCNTITQIVTALERYNIINGTNYKLDVDYKLYTINDCGICALVKNLIKSQNLKIQIIHAESDQQIEYLRKNKVHSFPALEIRAGEKTEFITGSEAGAYIASNMSIFK
jgi:glutaredoxin